MDCFPVTNVAGRQASEDRDEIIGEAELSRVELSPEYFFGDGHKPGTPCKLFVELSAHPLPLLLHIVNWAECENRHGPLGEGRAVPCQEAARVLVQAEHVKGRTQDDGMVSFEAANVRRRLKLDVQPMFAQRRRDCFSDFLSRALACGICN